MDDYSHLRQQAIKTIHNDDLSLYHKQKQIEELRIYQVELEIQNEELIKSREQIEQSQKYLSNLFQHAPVGYVVLSLKGIILDVNLMVSTYFGFSKEIMIKQRFQTYVLHQSLINFINCMSRLFELKSEVSSEILFMGNHSKRFWCKMTLKLMDHFNEEQKILCTLVDISNEKQVKQALLESNRKFNQAVEQSPVCIVITDMNANIEYVNPRFYEMTGYSNEEVIGKNPRILKSGNHSDEFYKDMWHALTNGTEWHGELCNKKKCGALYWESASISPVKNAEGVIANYIAVKENITHKKEMEIYIQNQLLFFQELIDTIPLPVFYSDHIGRINGYNRCFVNYTGLSDESLKKADIADILFKDRADYDELLDLKDMNAINKGIVQNFEMMFKHSDGSMRNIHLIIATYENSQNQMPLTIGVMVDITEYRKLQNDLENTIEKVIILAQKANEASIAKSQFLANMSHEIRTPMNAILGMLDIILSQTQLTEEQKDYIHTALDSSKNLLIIINDILDISKIEAKQMTLMPSHFDLYELIHSVYKTMIVQSSQKMLQLNLDIDHSVNRYVYGDSNRIRQILINIVGNAIKYTEKGHVSIQVNQDHDFQSDQQAVLCFVVSDTGVGIPYDQQELIFESFKQIDGSLTREYGGTGLGLAISKQLCEMMGGFIKLESDLGKGSKFTFTVQVKLSDASQVENNPLILNSNDSHKNDSHKINAATKKKHVLIVDDIQANIKVASLFLRKLGHDVSFTTNGLDAIEMLKNNAFDLILMDVEMPIISGIETTQRIREGQAGLHNKDITIIALTAHAVHGFEERCMEASMNGFISKPYTIESIEHAINITSSEQTHHKNEDIQEPIINPNELFDDLFDDKSIIIEILNQTQFDLSNLFNQLENSLNKMDMSNIKFYAHSIKGVAKNIGAHSLAQAALDIENETKTQNMENISSMFTLLKNTLNNVYKAIDDYGKDESNDANQVI